MAQGQETQLIIVFMGIEYLLAGGQLEQHIAMTDHGPLGRPGGTGSVDQHADVIGLALGNAGAELLFCIRDLFTQCVKFIQEHDHGIVKIPQPFAVINNDFFQGRYLITHGQVLVQLFIVFHKQEGRFTVVDQVGQLLGAVGGVDAVTDTTGTGNTQIAVQPFLVVFAENGYRLTTLQPKGQERNANGAGLFVIIQPTMALPDAQIFFTVSNIIAPLQALLSPEFDHGIATVKLSGCGVIFSHHQRQVFFRFQRFSGRSSPADWPR